MNTPYPYDLVLPPRHVPWGVRAQLFLGGGVNLFGWLWLGFSLIFVWVFGLLSDYSAVWFLMDAVETAPGVVTSIEGTGASVNDIPVFANSFTYRVERLESDYESVSYSTGHQFNPEQPVVVEYIRRSPEIARIEHTRRGQFDIWVIGIVLIFPLVGLGMIGFGLKNGFKANRLLGRGKIALGRLQSKKATNTRVNGRRVYKLTFAFTADDGQSYNVVCSTTHTRSLEDEPEERLLYDPYNPRYAVMLDNLPGSPNIDEMGHIQMRGLISDRLTILLPALVVGIHGVVFASILWWKIM